MALEASDLKKGGFIVIDEDPYRVISAKHLHMGRGGAVVQTKIRNLKSGVILERNFRAGDSIKEAEIHKMQARFIYARRDEYWFHEAGKPGNRFFIRSQSLEEKADLLKPEMEVVALKHIRDEKASPGAGRPREEIINIELPIKADYKVIHAPPGLRGNTSQGGTKVVTIEGGAKISVPLFIEEGDMIKINTDTREYDERG